jgi:hypothetical protein
VTETLFELASPEKRTRAGLSTDPRPHGEEAKGCTPLGPLTGYGDLLEVPSSVQLLRFPSL